MRFLIKDTHFFFFFFQRESERRRGSLALDSGRAETFASVLSTASESETKTTTTRLAAKFSLNLLSSDRRREKVAARECRTSAGFRAEGDAKAD